MDSGRSMVSTPAGRVPMQMRTYNIRTLDDRIEHLRRHVDQGKRDPQVYAFARRATSRKCGGKWCVPEKDNLGETKALFDALKRANPRAAKSANRDVAQARQVFGNQRGNVRYTSDIMGVDTYQKPAHTIALKAGDCDDHASLACSSLGSVGIPCRFKVIRTRGAKDWNHIYAQAGLPRHNPTHWISMDSSVNMPFGWEAPKSMVAASRTFRVV
jgi:transglutaminase-like putative cysteine protease